MTLNVRTANQRGMIAELAANGAQMRLLTGTSSWAEDAAGVGVFALTFRRQASPRFRSGREGVPREQVLAAACAHLDGVSEVVLDFRGERGGVSGFKAVSSKEAPGQRFRQKKHRVRQWGTRLRELLDVAALRLRRGHVLGGGRRHRRRETRERMRRCGGEVDPVG